MAHAARFSGRRSTFGESAGAQVRAVHVVDRGFDGTEADVETPAGRLHLSVPLAGRAQLSNVLAAATVAIELDVPLSSIAARTATLRATSRRGAVSELSGGARLVDDSYNASPSAMRAMLSALQVTSTAGRRIAVLGEMLELGDAARRLHEACGRAAAAAGVDELVVVGGGAAEALAAGAVSAGLDAGSHPLLRDQRRRGARGGGARAARRSGAGQGIARHPDGTRRRPPEGGGLMLYHLLYSLRDHVSGLRVVGYLTFRTAIASLTRSQSESGARSMAHRSASRVPDRAGRPIRTSRPATARRPARPRWGDC